MGNFDDEFGDLFGYKILSFEEVSKGFEGNKNPFNGSSLQNTKQSDYQDDGYVNLNALLDSIKIAYNKGRGVEMNYVYNKYPQNTPQTYIMDGEKHINFSAKIGLKDGVIKVSQSFGADIPFVEVFFDDNKQLTYTLSFCYIETRTVAIELRTHSFQEYKNLLLYIGYGDVEKDQAVSSFFVREFTQFLENPTNTAEDLYKVYADLPKSFIKHIFLSTGAVANHLKILTKEDDTGWFSWTKDTSSLLVKVMGMFRKYQEVADYFWKNPKFLTEIYDNLDGHSEVLGQNIPNRILFASVLNEFAKRDKNAKTKVSVNHLISGDGYFIESNITQLNDTLNTIKSIMSFDWDFDYKDAIFLQQKRKVEQNVKIIPKEGDPKAKETVTQNIDPGYLYHPMHLVHFVEKGEKAELVTALYLKAIADEKEWAEVMHYIRIGGDVFAIILGLITMGATGEVSAIAIADIGLASIDLALMDEDVKKWLSQSPEGKWFVENWDVIYALAGAGIMSYVIMEGILTYGPALLEKLKNLKNPISKYRSFITQLDELVKQISAYEAQLTKEGIIEEVIIAAKQNSSGIIKKLLKLIFPESIETFLKGAAEDLVEKGFSIVKQGEDYVVSYKGVEILKGKDRLTGEFLRSAHFSTRQGFRNFIAVYVNKVVANRFLHDATSGAKLLGNEDLGTYLVGSFWSDFENILKELNYPEITNPEILRDKNFGFPVPKGQKFNMLNVSKEVVEYFSKKGGFFNRVNAKWVDAAVRQKVEVVIMSDLNKLYKLKYNELGEFIGRDLTGFGKEFHRFEWKHGYRFNPKTKRMMPPSEAKGLKPLTKFEEHKIVD